MREYDAPAVNLFFKHFCCPTGWPILTLLFLFFARCCLFRPRSTTSRPSVTKLDLSSLKLFLGSHCARIHMGEDELLVVGFEGATKVSNRCCFLGGSGGKSTQDRRLFKEIWRYIYNSYIYIIHIYIIYIHLIPDIVNYTKLECAAFVESKPSCYNHWFLFFLGLEPRPAHIGPLVFRDGLVAQPVHHIGNPIGNAMELKLRRLETEARVRRNVEHMTYHCCNRMCQQIIISVRRHKGHGSLDYLRIRAWKP